MKISSPILVFTLLSGSIHTGMFLMSESVNMTLPGTTGSVISIKLEQDTAQSIPKLRQNTQKLKQAQPEKIQQLSQLSKDNTTITEPQTKKRALHADNELNEQDEVTVIANKNNAVARAQVIAIVHKQLNNYFEYPLIAQRHNWQGKVIIGFKITREGSIENIQISQSSGFNILDQAAIDSLKKIGQLPQLTSWLNTGMEIQLPVIYQLTEG